ncbi:MAG TPA: peptide chain release factor N(5)-glutamine methyltransferase [Deltaproteobacteria bacterium]|nr:peptide chain release factor N(5)-glutamine methyltransferase [Deltaproteobacteria bacterium]HOM28554.1 peptide chain release factor N(5)-glutamine methyltransferase [Deltaproteobacteria bacterium]HPP81712.1 peptide chain release factor N(5)-glutamine methyltransferase [Deltaproteobacteria bacterium]
MATCVARALASARAVLAGAGIESASLDAQVLLCRCLHATRERLVADPNRELTPGEESEFMAMVGRRARREPVAYIVGSKEFYGRDFAVNPEVLIPRPETELLVELACTRAPRGGTVFEVGVGSGAVICSILAERRDLKGVANDVSMGAVKTALMNARALGVADRLTLFRGRFLEGLAVGVDLVVANPPYVSDGDMRLLPEEVRLFEPEEALRGGPDGLRVVKEIIFGAREALCPGGEILMEVGYGQKDAVEKLFLGCGGMTVTGWVRDLAGIERVVIGKRCHG